MGDVVPLRRVKPARDELEAYRQAPMMRDYLAPGRWRVWCEQHGLIVKEVEGELTAWLPDVDEDGT